MKKALITGVTGQDGSYLAESLIEKGYEVHGIKRRASSFNTQRIDHISPNDLRLHYGDVTDTSNVIRLLNEIKPDEVYNLGAQSHVMVSFETPEYTASTDGLGALRLLEGIRILDMKDKTRLYQASTSELYGNAPGYLRNETTPFMPRSPYGAAKLYAYWITRNYREAYGLHASNGILFNHESPRRGPTFVTRKITQAAAAISLGRQQILTLGNLDALRDWGHAKDYVEGMHLALQQDTPGDYVLATGEAHTVREFVDEAFRVAGITLVWYGSGIGEVAVDAATGITRVAIDPKYFRPTEVDILRGDATKAREKLGWAPKVSFSELVREMVAADIRELVLA